MTVTVTAETPQMSRINGQKSPVCVGLMGAELTVTGDPGTPPNRRRARRNLTRYTNRAAPVNPVLLIDVHNLSENKFKQ